MQIINRKFLRATLLNTINLLVLGFVITMATGIGCKEDEIPEVAAKGWIECDQMEGASVGHQIHEFFSRR